MVHISWGHFLSKVGPQDTDLVPLSLLLAFRRHLPDLDLSRKCQLTLLKFRARPQDARTPRLGPAASPSSLSLTFSQIDETASGSSPLLSVHVFLASWWPVDTVIVVLNAGGPTH